MDVDIRNFKTRQELEKYIQLNDVNQIKGAEEELARFGLGEGVTVYGKKIKTLNRKPIIQRLKRHGKNKTNS